MSSSNAPRQASNHTIATFNYNTSQAAPKIRLSSNNSPRQSSKVAVTRKSARHGELGLTDFKTRRNNTASGCDTVEVRAGPIPGAGGSKRVLRGIVVAAAIAATGKNLLISAARDRADGLTREEGVGPLTVWRKRAAPGG